MRRETTLSLICAGLAILASGLLLAASASRRTSGARASIAGQPRLPDGVFDVQLPPPVFRWIGDQRLVLDGGKLQPGTRESREFAVPRLEGMAVVLTGDSTVRYTLRSPAGRIFVPGETREDPGYHVLSRDTGIWMLTFKRPEVGTWGLTADAGTAKLPTHFDFDVRADDPVVEQAHVEVFPRDGHPRVVNRVDAGEPVYVRVFVATDDVAVPGVRWQVRVVAYPNGPLQTISVEDDGRHADGEPNDGLFVGAFVPEEALMYVVEADAATPKGIRYETKSRIEIEEQGDLCIADSIVVSPSPRIGEPVRLSVTVMNKAARDAHDARLLMFLTVPNRWGGRDTREVGEGDRTFDLPAGKAMRISTAWTPTEAQDYEVSLSVSPTRDPTGPDVLRKTVVMVR